MNYNKYIGLPYQNNGRTTSGVDCWGLACIFYRDELGIELPSYSHLYSTASDPEVVEAIKTHQDNWLPTSEARPGDLCLFNIYGEPAHVGIYVGDSHFLHAREGRDSVIESLSSSQWSKRFQGFYKYTSQPQVLAAGAPHPLKTQVAYDWTVAGTTVEDFAKFINQKYSVSERFAQQLAVTVDGKLVPRDQWATTVLEADQTVAYKSIAQGRNGTRLLLTLAVVVVAATYGVNVGEALGFAQGSTAAQAIGTMAINMAGMALVNAIAPIRMPGQNPDPGSAASLNLFTGASNQANRFGAIPVVLGKMRVTGLLGATPYIDTLTETSLINLLIVWGFGPLNVEDICVGSTPITSYYNDNPEQGFAQDFPAPVTLQGWPNEGGVDAFNKLYPRDVEQQQINLLLVNNAEDGSPWKNVVLAQQDTTSIDIAFSFPEGMRQLVISGADAGQVREARAAVEVQIRREDPVTGNFGDWVKRPSYTHSAGQTTSSYSNSIGRVGITGPEIVVGEDIVVNYEPLYQWFTYAISSTGEIRRFDGTATRSQNAEPAQDLIAKYRQGGYASLAGSATSYSRLPQIPQSGFVKLYTICVYGTNIVQTVNHIQGFSGVTGLGLTTQPLTIDSGWDDNGVTQTVVGVTVRIADGAVYALNAQQPQSGQTENIFSSRSLIGTQAVESTRFWNSFLNTHGVWFGSGTTFDRVQAVPFPETGYYNIEASADDEGAVYIDNRQVVGIPSPGYATTVSNLVYLEAGTYNVRVTAKNSGGGLAGVGCAITYTENGGLNNLPTPDTIITFGTPGFYHKRKDAFNFVYKIKNLIPGKYEVRVKRVDSDTSEPTTELRNYNKVSLLSVTGYADELDAQGRPQGPLNQIPNTNLARTAIRLQSTGKINGTVDGVNAIVQTMAHDWDRNENKWIVRATSNPASLFGYVLTHPGNAYRIEQADIYSQIDVEALQSWHEYCDDNGLEFNSVVTQTQSVMDVLRDICAAGRASPTYVDGKWGVIVDRPRAYVTQHFTPHNSWNFEASKVLPRLPDAFRITIPDEQRAYQANDIIVCNYGKTLQTAEVFEELSLPGVTNAYQAKRMARWHLAQLKLRPETYTLNVDFEYLVCTRGDLVRVSHDVPLWGVGTGRIKAKSGATLTLTEQVKLEAGKTYQIRVRLNTPSTVPGSDSALLTLAPITTTDLYSQVTLTQQVPSTVEVDNLFMIGEISQESQELIVLGVEPADNLTARLTLADYSPDIYSVDLDDSNTELPSFNANIAGKSNSTIQTSITQAPVITGTASASGLAEEISRGTFQNTLIVSFGNVPDLSISAQKIQTQVVLGDSDFSSSSLFGVFEIDKSAGSLTITGLKTQTIYKLRARYTNATGSISGPWSEVYYTTSEGKVINNYIAPGLVLDLDRTHIVAKPTTDLNKPANFKTYEFRLYKNTGTGDFWNLDPVANNILVVQSLDEGRFNLLDVPLPRISTAGITYRIACRALDNTNNYSTSSTLGTIVITTIQ